MTGVPTPPPPAGSSTPRAAGVVTSRRSSESSPATSAGLLASPAVPKPGEVWGARTGTSRKGRRTGSRGSRRRSVSARIGPPTTGRELPRPHEAARSPEPQPHQRSANLQEVTQVGGAESAGAPVDGPVAAPDAAQVREAVREFAHLYDHASGTAPSRDHGHDAIIADDVLPHVAPDAAPDVVGATAPAGGDTKAQQPVPRTRPVAARVLLLARYVSSVYAFVVVFLVLTAVVPALVAGWLPLSVVSGSMQPALPPGSVVMVEPAEPDAFYAAPAIIAFADPARPGQLLTHRVAATAAPDGRVVYTTKGDANAVADSDPVAHDEVVGAVRMVIPFAGLPVTWLHGGALGTLVAWVLVSVVAVAALFVRVRP